MSSHLSDIGFDARNADEFTELVKRAGDLGRRIRSPHGGYVKWSPGEGIELWVQVDTRTMTLIGCIPHFSGAARALLGLVEIRQDPSIHSILEGSIDAYASPSSDNPRSGLYSLTVDIPNFDLVRNQLRAPSIKEFQIAAFAQHLSCFANDEEHKAAQEKSAGPGPTFGPESFIPSGQFRPNGQRIDPPKAEAIIAGHIVKCEEIINPATQTRFVHLHVKTYGIEVDMVAEPASIEGKPLMGGVAYGTFWLSGRSISL